MVKHVKLFENWASSKTTLPEWLDPSKKNINRVPTMFHRDVLIMLEEDNEIVFNNKKTNEINFRSFSDYQVWHNKKFKSIEISQSNCKYKLEDCYGFPETDSIRLINNNIKSLRGLEHREFKDTFSIKNSNIENLKYCPTSKEFNFDRNPLLSYYGITANNIFCFDCTLCGNITYEKAGYTSYNKEWDQHNDPKFSGNIFCHFQFEVIKFYTSKLNEFNPWNQIYEDPNEVENYEFLFVPFYENSEKFRDKVKEYLPNVNLSGVTIGRTEVW